MMKMKMPLNFSAIQEIKIESNNISCRHVEKYKNPITDIKK